VPDLFQQGLKRARNRGLYVLEPKPNQLQIDLDGIRDIKVFCHQLYIMEQGKLTRSWRFRFTESKTKNHIHVTITLPTARPMEERLFLSLLLGDDLKRAAFNYVRVKNKNKYPVAFFESPHPKNVYVLRKKRA
jgi:hypothetical protein